MPSIITARKFIFSALRRLISRTSNTVTERFNKRRYHQSLQTAPIAQIDIAVDNSDVKNDIRFLKEEMHWLWSRFTEAHS